MPPTTEPVVNDVWAQASPLNQSATLTLPSGQVCKAMRMGMEGILAAGLLGDADSLTAYVGRRHLRDVKGGKGADHQELNIKTIAQDPEALKRIVFLVDRAVPMIVTEPQVLSHFRWLPEGGTEMIPADEREEGRVYTDQIGLEDKMFLFQYAVGGSASVERFRGQPNATVADVPDRKDVQSPAEPGTPSTGRKRKRKRPPRRR